MKINRIAILLAGLILLMTGLSTAGEEYKYDFGQDHKVRKVKVENGDAGALAKAIADQVKKVDERFTANRKALKIVHGLKNAPGYLANEVTGLIGDTHKDLTQAIQGVQPSGSEPLLAWVDDQFQQIQGTLPPPGPTASLPDTFAPRGGAMFASLRGFGLPMFAVAKPRSALPRNRSPPRRSRSPLPRRRRSLRSRRRSPSPRPTGSWTR